MLTAGLVAVFLEFLFSLFKGAKKNAKEDEVFMFFAEAIYGVFLLVCVGKAINIINGG